MAAIFICKSVLAPRKPCDFSLRRKIASDCDFSKGKNVPAAVWLATGTFATENCGDLRLRFLVLSVQNPPRNPLLGLSETGRIRFRRVRSQTPSSVSSSGLTEFRGASSVSSFRPIICVPKRTHRGSRRTNSVWKQYSLALFKAQLGEPFLGIFLRRGIGVGVKAVPVNNSSLGDKRAVS